METQDNSTNRSNKLLEHHWNLNSDEYQDQISFIWKHMDIRIDIHSYCDPPGRDKCIHFNFLINGEHTLFKFYYNCYGGGHRGKLPELLSENYRLTFRVSPHVIEIYEEKINQDDNPCTPADTLEVKKKDIWISVDKYYRSGWGYETPVKDDQIILWIKKSYCYQYSSDILMFKYELFSANLSLITLTSGNFSCQKIFDHCKSIGCGVYSSIGCEISDGNGVYRQFYWGRRGLEDLTIFEIIGFLKSLRCYHDWDDYDQFQSLYKSLGLTDIEIDNLLNKEI